jgi:YHS domain-containing protein
MYRIAFLVLAAVIALAGISTSAFAMCGMCPADKAEGADSHAAAPESTAINAGNKICPVSGDAVDGKTTYEYKGKAYNFCCSMCIDEFKKDPAKYIAKVEKESQ